MDGEKQDQEKKSTDGKEGAEKSNQRRFSNPNMWLIGAILIATAIMVLMSSGPQRSMIREEFFIAQLRDGNIATVANVGENEYVGMFKEAPNAPDQYDENGKLTRQEKDGKSVKLQQNFRVFLDPAMSEQKRAELEKLYDENNVHKPNTQANDNSTLMMILFSVVLPLAFLFLLLSMLRRTRDQLMGGGGFLSAFTKSPAKRYDEDENKKQTTFKDVAGLENVKADLQEIVDFLKDPERFQRLGGRVPKGVLLMGPPGTGKTLLARAVAGEADVPFYSVNGSEFIQMFVGVGASRVRDLFRMAKENEPAIIFIDEIDAVGRQRGAGLGGGHDEREQTLNQILGEMDGFDGKSSVIVVAATNRPDVLDPALLRPGRFDRHVSVDRPTLKGRLAIFKVHVRNLPLHDDVNLQRLAEGSIGLTGADIQNLCNEAALWATRQDRESVTMEDFEYARDKILMGAKREEVLTGEEKEKTAYHEAGHALLAWLCKGTDRVHKVTVIPRGRALGVTQTVPEEDRMNINESEIADRLAFILGGRAAEKIVYDEFSAGAENDLERATSMARRMVTKWGMSERLGPVSYKISDEDPFLGREMHQQRQFSEHTMQIIDEEVARILHDAADRAMEILSTHRDKLDTLTKALVEREEISESDMVELIGPSVHHHKESKKQDTEVTNPIVASSRLNNSD